MPRGGRGGSSRTLHEVVVGNIGVVYRGGNDFNADFTYRCYVKASRLKIGRAAGEEVTWLRSDGTVRFYRPLELPEPQDPVSED